jgi:hypothetical protein
MMPAPINNLHILTMMMVAVMVVLITHTGT